VSRAGALINVRGKDGEYLSKRVTGFTNAEEGGRRAYLAGRPAKGTGSIYSKTANWVPMSKWTGLVTGQNPASSEPAAEELLKLLRSV